MLPKIKDKRYNTRSTDEYENFPRPNEKYYKSFSHISLDLGTISTRRSERIEITTTLKNK